MKNSTHKQPTTFSTERYPAEYGGTHGKAKLATHDSMPVDGGETNVTMLERMRRYANHLESLILRKNDEMRSLQRAMQLRVEEEIQRVKMNERVMILQARQIAMGELLEYVAHHWRQPLNVIALVIQNMQVAWEAGEFDGTLLNRSVSRTMEQVGLLSRSIDHFRSFAKPSERPEPFAPMTCVEEILTLLSGCFDNFSSYEIRINDDSEGEIRIDGCQNAFRQVILNLLRYADETIQERQGSLGRTFRGVIEIRFRYADDAFVTIAHNGGGIDETLIDYIFDPFFITNNENRGLGNWLYLSRIIVENNLNGAIWAENTPHGTLFGIRLPAVLKEERRQ